MRYFNGNTYPFFYCHKACKLGYDGVLHAEVNNQDFQSMFLHLGCYIMTKYV